MLGAAHKMRGFSYVELIFAATILALLASVASPYLEKTLQRKKETELRENLREIRSAIDAYKAASDQGRIEKTIGDSGYPKRLDDLERGVVDMSDPQKKKIRFIRKIPADPLFEQPQANTQANVAINPAETWGKRSYESENDNPSEGEDVFDVYSRSQQVGLNGVPYAQW